MEALIVGLVFAAISLSCSYAFWRSDPHNRGRSALKRVRSVSIAAVKGGERIKLTGEVSALDPLMEAPVSKRPCIGFRLVVKARYGLDARYGNAEWDVVLDTEAATRFSISDDTGKANVQGPYLLVLDSPSVQLEKTSETMQRLQRAGLSTVRLHDTELRLMERLLQPGDRVSVCGRAFIEPDATAPPAGFRSPSLIPHLSGSKDEPIVVVDADEARRR